MVAESREIVAIHKSIIGSFETIVQRLIPLGMFI